MSHSPYPALSPPPGPTAISHAARPRRPDVAFTFADGRGDAQTVPLDEAAQVLRLWLAGVSPAFHVAEERREARPLQEPFDVAGLAVAHDVERIALREAGQSA